ncbi:MAG: Histone acetyltransferase [Frankiales bacterium]|nr:Histone acetyltransferase [Frankiales bacterium]
MVGGLRRPGRPGLTVPVEQVDPHDVDVRALLARHLELMHAQSPPEDVHALDADGLADRDVTLFGLRRDGQLLGLAGLGQLDGGHGEVKSMHTAEQARGQGVARVLLEHVLAVARSRGYRRLSLETGSQPGFAPARALYASVGFAPCGPFGTYVASPSSTFLALELPAPAG